MNSPFLYRFFSTLAKRFRPPAKPKPPEGAYSPDIKLVTREDAKAFVEEYRRNNGGHLKFLDVGGRQGEHRLLAEGFEHWILELDGDNENQRVIKGDICRCAHIESGTFDVCFSNNCFEHLREPWAAAAECVRITKPGGLLIHIAPFSWRYHPVPIDYYRFSHSGLAFLFERTELIETLLSGYDISIRRRNLRGGKIPGGFDLVPVDELGGWRENWLTVYVGRKMGPRRARNGQCGMRP